MIKQIMIASLLMTGAAAAKCGPSLDITLDADQREFMRGHTVISSETYERNSFGDLSLQNEYGASQDDTDTAGIRLTFKIPLGEDYCTEQESAKLFRDREYAKQASLKNIETKLKLCKQYGENHPLLEGQCK